MSHCGRFFWELCLVSPLIMFLTFTVIVGIILIIADAIRG